MQQTVDVPNAGKSFSGQTGKKDYIGFNKNEWPERTQSTHMKWVEEILNATTVADEECLERQYGVRYSALLELPYIDIVKMHIVDPMHNLFLGTAKRVMDI